MLPSFSQRLRLPDRQQLDRLGPLALIILLHIALFYGLRSNLPQPAAAIAAPKELFATFIAPAAAAQPTAPQRVPPVPQPRPPKASSTPPKAATKVPTPSPQPSSLPLQAAAPAVTTVTAAMTATNATPVAAESVAPPASPPVVAAPKTIVAGVEYVQLPRPEYPPQSRRLGEQGKIMLRVLVNEKGRPERVDLQQSSGSSRLDEAARQAVLHALFKPHIEDGKAVAVYAIVPIKFELNT